METIMPHLLLGAATIVIVVKFFILFGVLFTIITKIQNKLSK